jgi:hypothetical protein
MRVKFTSNRVVWADDVKIGRFGRSEHGWYFHPNEWHITILPVIERRTQAEVKRALIRFLMLAKSPRSPAGASGN